MSSEESPPRLDAAVAHEESEDDDDASSSSDDGLLFKYPRRGAFKRRVEKSDSDDSDDSDGEGKGKGAGGDGDSDSDEVSIGDSASVSATALSRGRRESARSAAGGDAAAAAGRRGRRGEEVDLATMFSDSDDDGVPMPAPKRRREILDDAELEARVKAKVDAILEGSDGGSSAPLRSSVNKKDQAYARKMEKKLADATNIEVGARKTRTGGRSSSSSSSLAGAAAAAAAAAAAGSAETAARHLREQDRRSVKLRVERNKRQKHVFHAKRGTQVAVVEERCREELDLLCRDESDDAEIALFFEDKKLESGQSLREAGIPEGAVTLRLEVSGGGGGGGATSGPPVTLKVRVEGGKMFKVGTTMETKFSAIMEAFNEKVGVPSERASEAIFRFEGDRLNPEGSPEGEDMEQDDMIDVKFPHDLMGSIQAAPTELSLVAPKKKRVPRKPASKGKGASRGGGSTTAAALAATATPLGRAGAATRSTRSGGARGSRSGSRAASAAAAAAAAEPEIIVLD